MASQTDSATSWRDKVSESSETTTGGLGDEIAQCLPDAIKDSAAATVIISPRYANSRWCLEELAQICECERLILTVFYLVDPLNMRRQKGPFEEDLRSLESRFGEQQDQFSVSVNHVRALAIHVSTLHYFKNPSAIDQETLAQYTTRTAFERPLLRGVAYAQRVFHTEREMDRSAVTIGPGMDIPIMHDNDRYELMRDIGAGNFGVARLMRDRQTKELVAVKYIERGEKIDEKCTKEIINHRSLRHPIRFKEVILIPTHLAIVIEYASGEPVNNLMNSWTK
ncbi:hypothetical protein ACSBR2_014423 [Camellia fascicularis]